MKKKLLLFALAALTGGIIISNAASAQIVSNSEDFTLTIDDAYRWFFNPAANDFGGITSDDFNATVNNTGTSDNHQIILGDGTADAQASDTYMETNSEAQADTQTYQLAISTTASTTATFTDASTINVTDTNVANAGTDIDVNFLIQDSGFAAGATLGDVAFVKLDDATLQIAAPSFTYVDPEGLGASAAALDMGLDFDESTLNYDDTVGAADEVIGFTLQFTVLAVD